MQVDSFFLFYEQMILGSGQYAFDPISRIVIRRLIYENQESEDFLNFFRILMKFPLTQSVYIILGNLIDEFILHKKFATLNVLAKKPIKG